MQRRTLLHVFAATALTLALPAPGWAADAPASPLPYDESANAQQDVQRAFDTAARSKKPVLVIFGANWCEDCRALDKALKSSANAGLVDKEFVVIKVDVGRFNKNLDIAEQMGNAIKKGIPAAAVLSPQQELIYTTKAGELSNARRMSDTGVYEFFEQIANSAKSKPKHAS